MPNIGILTNKCLFQPKYVSEPENSYAHNNAFRGTVMWQRVISVTLVVFEIITIFDIFWPQTLYRPYNAYSTF